MTVLAKETSNTQRYVISIALLSYWLGSSALTYKWVFFTPHNTVMDEQVAFGLAFFIVGGWTLAGFALYRPPNPNQNAPTVNSQNLSSVCAVKLTLPYAR